MASIKFIEQRIAGKEREMEKLTKKMACIEAAAASGWTFTAKGIIQHIDGTIE